MKGSVASLTIVYDQGWDLYFGAWAGVEFENLKGLQEFSD